MENEKKEQNDQSDQSFLQTIKSKVTKFYKNITVEPILFFLFFGIAVQAVLNSNLYYEKICKVGSAWFNNGTTFSDEICDQLDNGNNSAYQTYVQKTYAKVHFFLNYAQGIPPIFFVLFLGPWSDHAGRKLIILIPLFGYMFYDLCFMVNAIFFRQLQVEFMMLECLQDCFGSGQLVFLGCYSYLSDVTVKKTQSRLFRMSLLDAIGFSAWAIGSALGAAIYSALGYVGVHLCGLICHAIAILYGFFILKESRLKSKNNNNEDTKEKIEKKVQQESVGKCHGLFKLQNLKQSFTVAFKKREGSARTVIILLVLLFGAYEVATGGMGAVKSQYVRKRFTWETTDYFAKWWSLFSSLDTVFELIALAIVSPLLSMVFHLSDLSVVMVSMVSTILGILIYLTARIPEVLYLAGLLGMLKDLITLGIRSTVSKIVGSDDVGKVFACIGAVQAGARLLSPLYNLLYLATLDWYIGFVFCISETMFLVMLTITGVCYFLLKK